MSQTVNALPALLALSPLAGVILLHAMVSLFGGVMPRLRGE